MNVNRLVEKRKICDAGTLFVQKGAPRAKGLWCCQMPRPQEQIELGDVDDTFTDRNAKVVLVLDNVDVNCTVAPGVIFRSVYECDNTWEDRDEYSAKVDTSDAGAVVVIGDGTDNSITGTNVFHMLKTKYKNENEETSEGRVHIQKKMRKTDGALYSYMTMNIDSDGNGTGALTVTSGFEGIDSELHLTVNGGNITVNSQDDGMNVNEDHVSVASFLGGYVMLNAALGAEGDGIDSNGYIYINGGTIESKGIRVSDSTLDSEDGTLYETGTVIIDGGTQSYEAGAVIKDGFGGFGGQMLMAPKTILYT